MVAGFPRIDGNTRFDVYEWRTQENDHKLDVQELTRKFAIPFGSHLFIHKIENFLSDGDSYEIFFDLQESQTRQNEFMELGTGNEFMLRPRHDFVLGTSALVPIPKFYNVEVFENITLHKATNTHIPVLTIYFSYIPGPMNWLSKWASLFRQRRNIPKLTTAGRKFHQVGNYHVLRRYNLL